MKKKNKDKKINNKYFFKDNLKMNKNKKKNKKKKNIKIKKKIFLQTSKEGLSDLFNYYEITIKFILIYSF
jgi:hypothetical protein